MSKEALEKVNSELISHLRETEVLNACYYAPVSPDSYWSENNKYKIAFCNLEPYSARNTSDTIKGIQVLDKNRLYDHWFFTKTTGNTIFLNLVLKMKLYENKVITDKTFKEIRQHAKVEKKNELYYRLCENFDSSLYFNFRYSQSGTVNQDKLHIYKAYITDDFYRNHYRKYVSAAEVDILIVSGKVGADLIRFIYPELKGKFEFKGPPVMFDGTLFVSVQHFSRISYTAMADCINKISDAMKK